MLSISSQIHYHFLFFIATNISESLKTEFEEITSKHKQEIHVFTSKLESRIAMLSDNQKKLNEINTKMESNIQKV